MSVTTHRGRLAAVGLGAVVSCLAFLSAGCTTVATERRDAPRTAALRIDSDPLIATLARAVSERVPTVDVRVSSPTGSPWLAIADGTLDLALAPANIAYFNYMDGVRTGLAADRQLRVISALHVTPFVIAVPRHSRIRTVADLRGKTLARYSRFSPASRQPEPATPAPSSDPTRPSELILGAFGALEGIRIVQYGDADVLARDLKAGTVDAIFGAAYFAQEVLERVAADGAHFIPIDGRPIDALQWKFPFIRPALVLANSYPGVQESVRTVGVDLLLVCRSGLSAALVYDITREYFAALPRLSTTDAISRTDLERASVSPIPLHEGAARYYQESELYR